MKKRLAAYTASAACFDGNRLRKFQHCRRGNRNKMSLGKECQDHEEE